MAHRGFSVLLHGLLAEQLAGVSRFQAAHSQHLSLYVAMVLSPFHPQRLHRVHWHGCLQPLVRGCAAVAEGRVHDAGLVVLVNLLKEFAAAWPSSSVRIQHHAPMVTKLFQIGCAARAVTHELRHSQHMPKQLLDSMESTGLVTHILGGLSMAFVWLVGYSPSATAKDMADLPELAAKLDPSLEQALLSMSNAVIAVLREVCQTMVPTPPVLLCDKAMSLLWQFLAMPATVANAQSCIEFVLMLSHAKCVRLARIEHALLLLRALPAEAAASMHRIMAALLQDAERPHPETPLSAHVVLEQSLQEYAAVARSCAPPRSGPLDQHAVPVGIAQPHPHAWPASPLVPSAQEPASASAAPLVLPTVPVHFQRSLRSTRVIDENQAIVLQDPTFIARMLALLAITPPQNTRRAVAKQRPRPRLLHMPQTEQLVRAQAALHGLDHHVEAHEGVIALDMVLNACIMAICDDLGEDGHQLAPLAQTFAAGLEGPEHPVEVPPAVMSSADMADDVDVLSSLAWFNTCAVPADKPGYVPQCRALPAGTDPGLALAASAASCAAAQAAAAPAVPRAGYSLPRALSRSSPRALLTMMQRVDDVEKLTNALSMMPVAARRAFALELVATLLPMPSGPALSYYVHRMLGELGRGRGGAQELFAWVRQRRAAARSSQEFCQPPPLIALLSADSWRSLHDIVHVQVPAALAGDCMVTHWDQALLARAVHASVAPSHEPAQLAPLAEANPAALQQGALAAPRAPRTVEVHHSSPGEVAAAKASADQAPGLDDCGLPSPAHRGAAAGGAPTAVAQRLPESAYSAAAQLVAELQRSASHARPAAQVQLAAGAAMQAGEAVVGLPGLLNLPWQDLLAHYDKPRKALAKHAWRKLGAGAQRMLGTLAGAHSQLVLQNQQTEVICALAALMSSQGRGHAQRQLIKQGGLRVLATLLSVQRWQAAPRPAGFRPPRLHGPSCTCTPETASQIQQLRVLQGLFDTSSAATPAGRWAHSRQLLTVHELQWMQTLELAAAPRSEQSQPLQAGEPLLCGQEAAAELAQAVLLRARALDAGQPVCLWDARGAPVQPADACTPQGLASYVHTAEVWLQDFNAQVQSAGAYDAWVEAAAAKQVLGTAIGIDSAGCGHCSSWYRAWWHRGERAPLASPAELVHSVVRNVGVAGIAAVSANSLISVLAQHSSLAQVAAQERADARAAGSHALQPLARLALGRLVAVLEPGMHPDLQIAPAQGHRLPRELAPASAGANACAERAPGEWRLRQRPDGYASAGQRELRCVGSAGVRSGGQAVRSRLTDSSRIMDLTPYAGGVDWSPLREDAAAKEQQPAQAGTGLAPAPELAFSGMYRQLDGVASVQQVISSPHTSIPAKLACIALQCSMLTPTRMWANAVLDSFARVAPPIARAWLSQSGLMADLLGSLMWQWDTRLRRAHSDAVWLEGMLDGARRAAEEQRPRKSGCGGDRVPSKHLLQNTHDALVHLMLTCPFNMLLADDLLGARGSWAVLSMACTTPDSYNLLHRAQLLNMWWLHAARSVGPASQLASSCAHWDAQQWATWAASMPVLFHDSAPVALPGKRAAVEARIPTLREQPGCAGQPALPAWSLLSQRAAAQLTDAERRTWFDDEQGLDMPASVGALPLPDEHAVPSAAPGCVSTHFTRACYSHAVPMLWMFMADTHVGGLHQSNLCEMNTAMLHFMVAHAQGRLPALVGAVREYDAQVLAWAQALVASDHTAAAAVEHARCLGRGVLDVLRSAGKSHLASLRSADDSAVGAPRWVPTLHQLAETLEELGEDLSDDAGHPDYTRELGMSDASDSDAFDDMEGDESGSDGSSFGAAFQDEDELDDFTGSEGSLASQGMRGHAQHHAHWDRVRGCGRPIPESRGEAQVPPEDKCPLGTATDVALGQFSRVLGMWTQFYGAMLRDHESLLASSGFPYEDWLDTVRLLLGQPQVCGHGASEFPLAAASAAQPSYRAGCVLLPCAGE